MNKTDVLFYIIEFADSMKLQAFLESQLPILIEHLY